jgi:hypothetical protein
MEGKELSLVRKLAEVMDEVEPVEQLGVDANDAAYAMEGDIYKSVRKLLAGRQVMLLIAELAREHRTSEFTKNDGQIIRTPLVDVLVRFTFMDGESGETYVFHLVGTRPDRGGTGGAQAITSAIRAALVKTFLIPMAEPPSGGGSGDAGASGAASGQRGARGAQKGSQGVVWTLEGYLVPIGRQKGKTIPEHTDENLRWLLALTPPDNDRFHKEYEQRMVLLEAEAKNRGWERNAGRWQAASPQATATGEDAS